MESLPAAQVDQLLRKILAEMPDEFPGYLLTPSFSPSTYWHHLKILVEHFADKLEPIIAFSAEQGTWRIQMNGANPVYVGQTELALGIARATLRGLTTLREKSDADRSPPEPAERPGCNEPISRAGAMAQPPPADARRPHP